ncbi:NAD(P)-binding protein [Favolaschia claudopus]|uniref:NAD(P)-binding protein n=1 Tax=Favolaschia claudopus TaxID=2862362 RepID=A0AAW0APR3_9AGAR
MTSRVWFITGASSGFGLYMAEKALENGEKVIATLRKPEVLSDLVNDDLEKKTQNKQLLVLKVDVTIKEEVKAAFVTAKQTFGRIDVVFNNAGYGIISEVEGISDANARNLFEVNFWGSFNVTKEALQYFRQNDPIGGLLINMSSMFGVDAPPGAGFYAATCVICSILFDFLFIPIHFALANLVMIFCPGWFKTNMTLVNAVVEDVHPEYAGKSNLGSMQLGVGLIRGDSPLLKDARKLINKFWDLSKLENPPYRIAFGDDAKAAFSARWTAIKSDLETSEEWSKDLAFD